MFRDREDAGRQLGQILKSRTLVRPVVIGIPRGGVVTAASLARELVSDLDSDRSVELNVTFARKLRAPFQSELAIGAIAENGDVFWQYRNMATDDYCEQEINHQLMEIRRRRALVSKILPPLQIAGRSVIVTDDGVATGSTMLATIKSLNNQMPHEMIVAVPVAPSDTLSRLKSACDDLLCIEKPSRFFGVGEFYEDFSEVSDDKMLNVLKNFQHEVRHSYGYDSKDVRESDSGSLL